MIARRFWKQSEKYLIAHSYRFCCVVLVVGGGGTKLFGVGTLELRGYSVGVIKGSFVRK